MSEREKIDRLKNEIRQQRLQNHLSEEAQRQAQTEQAERARLQKIAERELAEEEEQNRRAEWQRITAERARDEQERQREFERVKPFLQREARVLFNAFSPHVSNANKQWLLLEKEWVLFNNDTQLQLHPGWFFREGEKMLTLTAQFKAGSVSFNFNEATYSIQKITTESPGNSHDGPVRSTSIEKTWETNTTGEWPANHALNNLVGKLNEYTNSAPPFYKRSNYYTRANKFLYAAILAYGLMRGCDKEEKKKHAAIQDNNQSQIQMILER